MTKDNVVPLRLVEVGDGAVIDCDKILAAAAGNYSETVVLGFNKAGEVDIRSSHSIRDALFLIEAAKTVLMEIAFDGA